MVKANAEIKPKKIKTIQPKKAEFITVNPVSVRKVNAKKSLKFPVKVTMGKGKTAEKQLCPHHYFMKCSSLHFLLGIIAGFLIGILVASI